MAKNKVQFQKGLSFMEFFKRYGTQKKCEKELFRHRWPKGFICPRCGGKEYSEYEKRGLYQCSSCRHQTSITAGTIFHSTNLPLTTWFFCMYLMTQSKNGVSSLELSRQLGIGYRSAWRMKQKIMQVMLQSDSAKRLHGQIEMDDSYLGGYRPGEKRGRGTPGKIPFVAAVEKNSENRPMRIKLTKIKTFSMYEIECWSRRNLVPGSVVTTDGLYCFTQVTKAGCVHKPKKTGSGRQSALHPSFHWVNTVLGNLKSSILGTYRFVSKKHAARYLAEFQYRFNRRFDMRGMLRKLSISSVNTSPWPEHRLVLAENWG